MEENSPSSKPGEIHSTETGEISHALDECPVCHSVLPPFDQKPGLTLECGICFADLEVSPDCERLIFKKFGGKAFGQL